MNTYIITMTTLYSGKVEGRERQLKTQGTGRWFSTSKAVARSYSRLVRTFQFDETKYNGLVIDCLGKNYREVNTDAIAKNHVSDYDFIIFKNIVDIGPHYASVEITGNPNGSYREELHKFFLADTYVLNPSVEFEKVDEEIMSRKLFSKVFSDEDDDVLGEVNKFSNNPLKGISDFVDKHGKNIIKRMLGGNSK